ncbi:MAG: TMEM165/GDT1 family protein [Magnetococcales bacterium]|nr:TMEM165/GDT1 family protein [Magnetococcales bacterium]MBF0439148.1 TMEM165/GDT1 family protein [Magnetococcales bacterium]
MTSALAAPDSVSFLTTTATTFALIFLAEIGDKTQLVCMTLAARHRGWPVFLGASLAFLLLNVLAVAFGAALAQWLPANVMILIVAGLFALFGIQSLRASGDDEEEDENAEPKSGSSILITTFMLIFVAELGDKTQIAVASLAGTAPPIPVWVGGTLALVLSAGLGVVAGRKLLARVPLRLLNKISGIFFLSLAVLALTRLQW